MDMHSFSMLDPSPYSLKRLLDPELDPDPLKVNAVPKHSTVPSHFVSADFTFLLETFGQVPYCGFKS
jgi:hypothetical protein